MEVDQFLQKSKNSSIHSCKVKKSGNDFSCKSYMTPVMWWNGEILVTSIFIFLLFSFYFNLICIVSYSTNPYQVCKKFIQYISNLSHMVLIYKIKNIEWNRNIPLLTISIRCRNMTFSWIREKFKLKKLLTLPIFNWTCYFVISQSNPLAVILVYFDIFCTIFLVLLHICVVFLHFLCSTLVYFFNSILSFFYSKDVVYFYNTILKFCTNRKN